jgi:2-oxoglutarate ferredoxin oxidoreductase subunit alpha
MGNEHEKAAYFSRGTGHDEFGNYSEDPEVWQRMLDRIQMKFNTAREKLPPPHFRSLDGAKVGLIGMGSTEPAIIEAQDELKKLGFKTDYMRIRALPFSKQVREFIQAHERNYVLELNRDGQLHEILLIDFPELAECMTSLAYIDGLPMTADWIIETLSAKEQKGHG